MCCRPDGLAYYQPPNGVATGIFPCFYYHGIIAIYYTDMMLGGTLLDDAEIWSSLDSVLVFIISGTTSAFVHQLHKAGKAYTSLGRGGLVTSAQLSCKDKLWGVGLRLEGGLCMQ